jgi:selenoprotein W-related protein
MAEQLLQHYGKDISSLTLVPSSGGRFEVSVEGELLFSKLKVGRFPDFAELRRLIDRIS